MPHEDPHIPHNDDHQNLVETTDSAVAVASTEFKEVAPASNRRKALRSLGLLGGAGLGAAILAACSPPNQQDQEASGGRSSAPSGSPDDTTSGSGGGTSKNRRVSSEKKEQDGEGSSSKKPKPINSTRNRVSTRNPTVKAPDTGTEVQNGDAPKDTSVKRKAKSHKPKSNTASPPTQVDIEKEAELSPGLKLKTTEAWHAARRAAIAVDSAIVADIESMGVSAWLDKQLKPDTIDDSVVEGYIKRFFPWATSTLAQNMKEKPDQLFKAGPATVQSLLARIRYSERVLHENVVSMLADHVYVPASGKAEHYAAEYDAIIRKHAFGKYTDLLLALIKHPALLNELDNQLSTKEEPNENLGRELLELYTVGRDVYKEEDVLQSAIILTGHTEDWKKRVYKYDASKHRTGQVKVLDFSADNVRAEDGPKLLEDYIHYLTHHEGTAKRLAWRVAVRFIQDNPDENTINDLAKVYLDQDTSISALVRAAFEHPSFKDSIGKKWRRPQELLGTITRSAKIKNFNPVGKDFDRIYSMGVFGHHISKAGHLPRYWPNVDGYPDEAEYWGSSDVTLQLWNGAQASVVGDENEYGKIDWLKVLDVKAGSDSMEVARRITWHLTGYEWEERHLKDVAGLLSHGIEEKVSAPDQYDQGTTLPTDKPEDNVRNAVRLVFSSPYAFLR